MIRIAASLITLSVARDIVTLPDHGPLSGQTIKADSTLNQPLDQDVENYLGIPFAKPPVGELRFRSPQKFEGRWDTPRSFTTQAKDCMSGSKGSEDCLYLNVFVPASASASNPLPVMFWIYGGGFTFGRVSMYNGSALAAQENVIVVVPSYRFGPLGFFANEATLAESGTTGNWGILDQRMAMEWTRDNIEFFGGDKNKVTIFGESAGGISVATHMVSPGSQGLFHNAIIQSGVLDLDLFFLEKKNSYQFYDWMSSTMGLCSNGEDMECLRRIPASRFAIHESIRDHPEKAPTWAASLFPFFSFGLTIDNSVVFGTPLEMALAGKAAKVPLIIGLTQDEGTIFAMASPSIVRPKPSVPPTESDVVNIMEYFMGDRTFVENRFKQDFPKWRTQYPSPSTSEGQAVWEAQKCVEKDAFLAKPKNKWTDIDVSDLVKKHERNIKFGPGRKDQMAQSVFDEFFTRDLATEKFADIVVSAPETATIYHNNKLNQGRVKIDQYDRAPMSYLTSTARDIIFACPTLSFAAAHRDAGNKVFFYNLALDIWKGTIYYNVDLKAAAGKAGGDIAISDLGVFHGADIPLVFKLFKSKPTHPADVNLFGLFNLFTGNQVAERGDALHRVADAIGCYWANLAKCGDTNCGSSTCHGAPLLQWNALEKGSHEYLSFNPDGSLEMKDHQQTGSAEFGASLPSNEQCIIWDQAEFRYLDIKLHNNHHADM